MMSGFGRIFLTRHKKCKSWEMDKFDYVKINRYSKERKKKKHKLGEDSKNSLET